MSAESSVLSACPKLGPLDPLGGGAALTLEHLDDGSAYGELRVTERALFAVVRGVNPRVEKRCL